MSHRTDSVVQDRLASLASPSMAMTTAGAWVMCPVPGMGGGMSAWASLYQRAYEDAVCQMRVAAFRRETTFSLN